MTRVSIAFVLALLTLSANQPVAAQMMREHDVATLRGFHGPAVRIRRSFQSDAEARAVFAQILTAAGLAGMQDRIIVRASAETADAEATIEKDERLIFYNAVFMQKLRADAKDYWPAVAVLAHELGHHIRLHTIIAGRAHEFELEADYQAGHIMRRMGATLEQAQQLFLTLGSETATPSHPGRAQRLQAVTLGWTDGSGAAASSSAALSAQGAPAREWQDVKGTTSAAVLERFLQRHKDDPVYSALAQDALDGMKRQQRVGESARAKSDADAKRLALLQQQPVPAVALQPGAAFRDCKDGCPEMVVVPGGKFTMGSKDSGNEKPPHQVTIARAFAVGKFEVTFAEWDACVAGGGCAGNKSPSDQGWGRGRRPVVNVSIVDAREFASYLSRKTGKSYRLLSEAEWEYAARAGTTTDYPWGDAIGRGNASCDGCGSQWDNKQTAPVGSFKPNAFGLFDMHGNAGEWVQDGWHPDYDNAPTDGSVWSSGAVPTPVQRGGAWFDVPFGLRSSSRYTFSAGFSNRTVGFRVARTLDP